MTKPFNKDNMNLGPGLSATERFASGSQRAFVRTILKLKGEPMNETELHCMSMAKASEIIEEYIAAKKRKKT